MLRSKDVGGFSNHERKLVAEIRTLKSRLARLEQDHTVVPQNEIKHSEEVSAKNPYPAFRVDIDGTLIYANPACEKILTELYGGPLKQTLPEQWLKLARSALRSKTIKRAEFSHGDHIFSLRAMPVDNTGCVNVYGVDITELKQIETEQKTTLDLLHLINEQTDLESTLRDVMALLKQFSGCESVGVRLRDGYDFPYYETQGFDAKFVKLENSLCAVDQAGEVIRDSKGDPVIECMCGDVICGRFDPTLPFFTELGSFWSNCTTDFLASTNEADRQARMRNRCNGEGYESVALIPLRAGGEAFGLLQFNDTRRGQFTPQTITVFERMAQNLSASLAHQKLTHELYQSEQSLTKAQETAHIGNWEWDLANDTISGSHEMYRIFGLNNNQALLSDAVRKMVHPEDRYLFDHTLSEVHTSGSLPDFIESRIIDTHGKTKWICIQIDTTYDANGQLIRLCGTAQDITKHKLMEDAIHEQRDRIQKYLSVAGVIFIVIDSQGTTTLVNQKGCDLLGRDESDIVGKNWFDSFLPVCVREQAKTVHQELMAGNVKPVEYHENSILQSDGNERIIAWHNAVLRNKSGNVTGILCSGEDVTERKQAEQALSRNQAQLRSLASELVLTEERERNRIAVLLHDDVCQNLAYSKMKLQMVNAALDDQSQLADVTEVSDTLTQMMEEIRTLTFELSSPILTEFGLEAAMSQWLTEQIEQKHGIATEFADDGQTKSLEEDVQALLFRSVRELLANAVKHSQAKRIKVCISRVEDQVLIHLEDNGIGFDANKVVVGSATGGFGLFSIRERLSQLGGSLEIDSSPGQGCRSVLRAPLEQP